MKRQTAAQELSVPHLVESSEAQGRERRLGYDSVSSPNDVGAPRLHSLALEALAQIQVVLQTNTSLVQHAAALEEQVQHLLAERLALVQRIEYLEAQLMEPTSATPRAIERRPIPFRALTNLPAVSHHDLLDAVAFSRRFARTTTSDEETLLSGETLAPEASNDAVPAPPIAARPHDYALIARPFARFTDLGGFQAAVQALPGIENVRVRRFAQGALEMRVDYHGERPLAELLGDLTLPVEAISEEEPNRVHIHLRPLEERGFSPHS